MLNKPCLTDSRGSTEDQWVYYFLTRILGPLTSRTPDFYQLNSSNYKWYTTMYMIQIIRLSSGFTLAPLAPLIMTYGTRSPTCGAVAASRCIWDMRITEDRIFFASLNVKLII